MADVTEEIVDSWEEMLTFDDTEYINVPVGGGKSVRLGSLSAKDMLVWLAANEDPITQKTGGLVLVAKCIVNKKGDRIGILEEVIRLRDKQPKTIKKLVRAAVALNELNIKETEKNDSSGTEPSASSTDSGSQQAA